MKITNEAANSVYREMEEMIDEMNHNDLCISFDDFNFEFEKENTIDMRHIPLPYKEFGDLKNFIKTYSFFKNDIDNAIYIFDKILWRNENEN